MRHKHTAWRCVINMQHGHASWTCSMEMRHKHAAWACILDMQHGDKDKQCRPNEAWICSIVHTSSMYTLHVQSAWTSSMETYTCTMNLDMRYRNGHEILTWTCSMDMTCIKVQNRHGYQHGHGNAMLVLRVWYPSKQISARSDTPLNKFPRGMISRQISPNIIAFH